MSPTDERLQAYAAEKEYRCFHCQRVFVGYAAKNHFGLSFEDMLRPPTCVAPQEMLFDLMQAAGIEKTFVDDLDFGKSFDRMLQWIIFCRQEILVSKSRTILKGENDGK